MPRRPRPTIGSVPCAFCRETAAVRESKNGKRYYVCPCAPQPFYLHEHIDANATIWGEGGEPPDGTPDWIARGLGTSPAAERADRPRTPARSEPGPAPATDPAPPPADPPPPAPGPAPPGPPTSTRDDDERMTFGLFR